MAKANIHEWRKLNKDILTDGQLVARGMIPGSEGMFKFGRNPSVGTSEEDIWDGGGTYTWLTTAQTLEVVSDTVGDGPAGTGARTVSVTGLDSDYNVVSDTVILQGDTIVLTTQKFLRVYRAGVETAGTSEKNNANIYFWGSTDTAVLTAQITKEKGQTLMCIYTIPDSYIGYIHDITFYPGDVNKILTAELYTRAPGSSWRARIVADLHTSTPHPLSFHPALPARTDIRLAGIFDVANPASATFTVLLEKQ